MRVDVGGWTDGEYRQVSYGAAAHMPELTGLPLALGALMLARGEIDCPGVVAPEDCIEPEPFLAELARRGVHICDMSGQWPEAVAVPAGPSPLAVGLLALAGWLLVRWLRRTRARSCNSREEKRMTEKTVVLVTGVAGYWGARVAARLADEPGTHVIGLDVEPPRTQIEGLDFVQADVRNPLLAELLATEGVDTVCHLAFVETARPSDAAFDLNVPGHGQAARRLRPGRGAQGGAQEQHGRLWRPPRQPGLFARGSRPAGQQAQRHRPRPGRDRDLLRQLSPPAARPAADHPALPRHRRADGRHAPDPLSRGSGRRRRCWALTR